MENAPETRQNHSVQHAAATPPAKAVWDYVAQRRFKHLAVKEALATITEEELSELESLTSLRQRGVAAKSNASAENVADCLRLQRPPLAKPPSASPNSGR